MKLLKIFATKIRENTDKKTVQFVDISTLKLDKDFKKVFNQENDKVLEISFDMKRNGFDTTRPIIVTRDNFIVDGHSRFMAAKKAGLKKVPVMYKTFDSKNETIEYEYKMQLNSRRLSDSEYFSAFLKLDELRKNDINARGKTDETIGKQLNKSARQVSKMRELSKKASPELLEKIKSGKVSLNKAYEILKGKSQIQETNIKEQSKIGKGINSDSLQNCLSV